MAGFAAANCPLFLSNPRRMPSPFPLRRTLVIRCGGSNKAAPPGSEGTKIRSWKDAIAKAISFSSAVKNVPREPEETKTLWDYLDKDTVATIIRVVDHVVDGVNTLFRPTDAPVMTASDPAPALNPSSPYYLGSSDNPGMLLVVDLLTRDNYRNWAQLMKTALKAKTKLGFIDGSIRKPAPTSSDFIVWEKVDSMVKAWIVNSIHPDLHGSILFVGTARDVWLDLDERFAQTDAPRIHQLWCELCLIRQDKEMTVTDYYAKMRRLWDELRELQPLSDGTCEAAKEIARREENQCVHLFLSGLDVDRFDRVKSTILNIKPLPSLERTLDIVLKEESRL